MAYTLTTTTPSTVLDPGDPVLGSSYADGVERASRVKKKKKIADELAGSPTGTAPAPGAITPEDEGMLRAIGVMPNSEISPSDLEVYRELYRKMGRNSEQFRGGMFPPQSTPQSTILGG